MLHWTAGSRMAAAFAVCALLASTLTGMRASESPPVSRSSVDDLEVLRRSGDYIAQRAHAWSVLAGVIAARDAAVSGLPVFEGWHGEGELFGLASPTDAQPGIMGFYRAADTPAAGSGVDIPVLTYTLYNEASYEHIASNRLNYRATLDQLLAGGVGDSGVGGDRIVPEFPTTAIVMKTVWWPIARDGVTALPVWDPSDNPPLAYGNPYTSWHRVVGVDPKAEAPATVSLDFVGSRYPAARRVPLSAFYHVPVDASLAARIMADPPSAKAMLIALGRPLSAGDFLALVAVNLATHEVPNWIWVASWWHDNPEAGPFAAGRPASLAGPWHNYLMQVAFDARLPPDDGGGPHVAFNPWLEGRFPDGGGGPGIQSNCVSCHARASYPTIAFLPVTRGDPGTDTDQAFAAGRLRTSFLWALTMHARP